MSITDIAETVQAQVIDAVKAAQSAVVDAVRTWADTLENIIPEDRRAAVAERLPDPAEAVDRAFAFAERLLETQHEFVSRLVEASSLGRPATAGKAPAKTTSTKPAAAKAEPAA